MYKIFIVEDSRSIADSLEKYLSGWGYEVACCEDFDSVLTHFTAFSPQLVLLDISLPGKSGFYWCGEIRKLSKVPILFLSSAADNMNIVTAMNLGGDDFIGKPFDPAVLVSKMQALLRRTYEFGQSSELMEHNAVIFNTLSGCVHHGSQRAELTQNEQRILRVLMEQRGRIVSRTHIMQQLWENDSYVDDNTLTVNMTRLRKKLEEVGAHDFIQTKKGQGYMV